MIEEFEGNPDREWGDSAEGLFMLLLVSCHSLIRTQGRMEHICWGNVGFLHGGIWLSSL